MKFRLVESIEKEYDSLNRELSPEQIEFFKDSKVRDEEGRLLVCYHGSSNKFTEFSHDFLGTASDSGMYGDGFYFTDNIEDAKEYGDIIYEVYLNMKNPLIIKGAEQDTELLINLEDGVEDLVPDELLDKYDENELDVMNDEILQKRRENLQKYVLDKHDGIIDDEFRRNNYKPVIIIHDGGLYFTGFNEYVVYDANQIKLTSNKNPTDSDDMTEELCWEEKQ